MYVKIHRPKSYNKGSSSALVRYLEKENQDLSLEERQMFFSHQAAAVSSHEVIAEIDSNKAKLTKEDDKYYMLSINPSQKELESMCREITGREVREITELNRTEKYLLELKLRDYTREVMDRYAENFNRGLNGNDLVYYGKIEHQRHYNREDQKLIELRHQRIKLGIGDLDNISYCRSYYGDPQAQRMGHGMKEGNKEVLGEVSKEMVTKLPDNAVLIPMPSSSGHATYTKELAEAIQKLNPTLEVQDILKGTERDKLFELKQKGFEADKNYFNFSLSGQVPKGKQVYFIDNVLSTGITYAEAKRMIPEAKILVHGINEDLAIKRQKLRQVENIQNAPTEGSIKPGLQSHVHVVVSRKDNSNKIRLSPFANARDSKNKMPDGTTCQIGFDRQSFVQKCEATFDSQFSYKRDQTERFDYRHLMKNRMAQLTKSMTYNVLPPELRTIGKSIEVTYQIIQRLQQRDNNLQIVSELQKQIPHLERISRSEDVLKLQSVTINKDLLLLNDKGVLAGSEKEDFSRSVLSAKDQYASQIKECNQEIISLHKQLSTTTDKTQRQQLAIGINKMKDQKQGLVEKMFSGLSIGAKCDLSSQLIFSDNTINVSKDIAVNLERLGNEVNDIKAKFINFATIGLDNEKAARVQLRTVKSEQGHIYQVNDQIKGEAERLKEVKRHLLESQRAHAELFWMQQQAGTFDHVKYETYKETVNEVSKIYSYKISLVDRAMMDLKGQQSNLIDTSRLIQNTASPTDPINLARSMVNIPVAKEAMKAVSYACNPVNIAKDVVLKVVNAINNGVSV